MFAKLDFCSECVWIVMGRRVWSWVGAVYRSDGCLFAPSIDAASGVGAKNQPG